MEKLRSRKLNSVGCLRGSKRISAPEITVAFLREERFKKWRIESGKWKIPVNTERLSRHSEGFSSKNPYRRKGGVL